jgi:hypothetical protein
MTTYEMIEEITPPTILPKPPSRTVSGGSKSFKRLVRRTVSLWALNPRKSSTVDLNPLPVHPITRVPSRRASAGERSDSDSGTAAEEDDEEEVMTTSLSNSENLADEYRSLLAEHPLLYGEGRQDGEDVLLHDAVRRNSDGEVGGAVWSGLLAKAADVWERRRTKEGRWMKMVGGDVRRQNVGGMGMGIGMRKPFGVHYL